MTGTANPRQVFSSPSRAFARSGSASRNTSCAAGLPLWTCPLGARLIADKFGDDYYEDHVWKNLRRPGWSPQCPVGQVLRRMHRKPR